MIEKIILEKSLIEKCREEERINDYKEKVKDFYNLITDRFNELEDWEYPMLITKLIDFCIWTYDYSSYTQEEWGGIIRNLKIKEIVNK